jgi:polyphenol oxidase
VTGADAGGDPRGHGPSRSATAALPPGVRRVREEVEAGAVPLHVHAEWAEELPWLLQGTTGAGDGSDPFDLGLFGDTPVGVALDRWRRLREAVGVDAAVHSLQVHGDAVQHHGAPTPGLFVSEGYDGHLTDRSGVLLTISVADCVPISLVDPKRRRIALLHGGWRGTAAGILGRGLDALAAEPERVRVHLGPAICGRCYEVGPEVHAALGLRRPPGNRPVDVRAVQARQAVEAGVPAASITVSEHCTHCGTGFFSHRGGSAARQLGLLAIRP